MSITNPFNFGLRIGSIDTPANKPEVSGRIIAIRRSRWRYKYGIGSSNPLDPAVREDYIEYIDVGEPDAPWDPIGGGGSSLGGSGGGSGGGIPCAKNKPGQPQFPVFYDNGLGRSTCCSPTAAKAILDAFSKTMSDPKISSCLNQFDGLVKCLTDTWINGGVKILCVAGVTGMSSRNQSISIGKNFLDPNKDLNKLGAEIIHELIHLCGGTELDSAAIEFCCFPNGQKSDANPIIYNYIKNQTGPYDFHASRLRAVGSNGTVRILYRGRWVAWEPDDGSGIGKLYVVNRASKTTDPLGDQLSHLFCQSTEWYRP